MRESGGVAVLQGAHWLQHNGVAMRSCSRTAVRACYFVGAHKSQFYYDNVVFTMQLLKAWIQTGWLSIRYYRGGGMLCNCACMRRVGNEKDCSPGKGGGVWLCVRLCMR